MFPSRKLHFFISSTANLQQERAVVQQVLATFDIDGLRFEEWPSMPDDPMEVCLEGVRNSHAVVLLLGTCYGTVDHSGISGTHQEFRYAQKLGRPIFVFLLNAEAREQAQLDFIAEVQKSKFRSREIGSTEQLAQQLRASVAAEFARRWQQFERRPPEAPSPFEPQEATPIAGDVGRDELLAELKQRYDAGDDDAISAAADDILRRYPNDPDLLSFIYQAEVNHGIDHRGVNRARVEAAAEFWRRSRAVGIAARAGAAYCLGNALSVLGRFDEAIAAYRDALELHPEFVECWKNLGSVYHNRGDHQAARSAYERALALQPRKFEALYSLATLLLRHLDDPAAALTNLELIDLASLEASRVASVLAWRAEAKLRLGRVADAAADAEEAIAVSSDAEWTWTAAARVYAQARHSEKSLILAAVRFWERFVVRFPKAPEAWYELGFLLFRARDIRERKEYSRRCRIAFQKAIELGVNDPLVWDRIGHLFQEEGRWAEAAERYAKAAAGDPASHGYCYGLALTHVGRYEEALPFALAAAETHQPDAMSWTVVADCRIKLNDVEGAVAAYHKAIEIDPDYAKAWFDLGGLFWNLRDAEMAFAVWDEALMRFSGSDEAAKLMTFLDAYEKSKGSTSQGSSAAESP
jgi:tetratricopeptide (TPR) repeat protein